MNDHCVFTIDGRQWRIVAMAGLACIRVTTLDGMYGGRLDLSAANLEAYCAQAVEYLAERMDVSNAEIVEP